MIDTYEDAMRALENIAAYDLVPITILDDLIVYFTRSKIEREWRAKHRTHWSQPFDEIIVHHSTYRDDVVEKRLEAARNHAEASL